MGKKGKQSKANRAKRRQGTCVYCGEAATCTDEHVIPECLFPEGQRPPKSDFAIVPACEDCNGLKSKEDTYIRDVFTADAACQGNPVVRAVLNPVFRSITKNKSDFGRTARNRTRVVEIRSPNGLYLGHGAAVPIDWQRIDRFFRWVVRGLYWFAANQRLPDDCMFRVLRLYASAVPERQEHFRKHNAHGPFRIGMGVFECSVLVVNENAFMTYWLFAFYESLFFTVVTCPREDANQLEVGGRPICVP